MKLSIRQFLAGDVGQERLSLVPRILEAGELVTDGVAMKPVTITDVEIIACHVQSGGPGQGTRLPTASEPRIERGDPRNWHQTWPVCINIR